MVQQNSSDGNSTVHIQVYDLLYLLAAIMSHAHVCIVKRRCYGITEFDAVYYVRDLSCTLPTCMFSFVQ